MPHPNLAAPEINLANPQELARTSPHQFPQHNPAKHTQTQTHTMAPSPSPSATLPTASLGCLHRADGSASFTHNSTQILASVNGPMEIRARDEHYSKAVLEIVVRPGIGVASAYFYPCLSPSLPTHLIVGFLEGEAN